jgi:hypothetical protein
MDAIAAIDRFVHVPLGNQAGLSGFGALLQVARLNHFRAQDLHAAFGLRFQYREDLSQVLVFSPKRKASLITALGVAPAIATLWAVDPWQPFEGGNPWPHLPWRLRACASCLRVGYHSNLFQMPWIVRCPWHRERLIERCRRCERPLLEGFRERKALLFCACGHDPVDETAVLRGERPAVVGERQAQIDAYVTWAASRRTAGDRLLCPEEADAQGAEALAALLSHGDVTQDRAVATGVHLVARTRRPGPRVTDADYAVMVASAHGLWPDAPGLAGVPRHFDDGLFHIGRNIAARVPEGALSARERKAMALAPVHKPATDLSRYELLFLPAQRSQGRVTLDTRVLHQTARRAVANLAWELLCNDPARLSADNGSHRLLLNAIQQTVGRGYADGLKHVLGRHVPAIFDHPRIRSGPRLPWVLITKQQGTAHTVKVAWTMRRPWDAAALPIPPAAKDSPQ